jgi:hypothetical protein
MWYATYVRVGSSARPFGVWATRAVGFLLWSCNVAKSAADMSSAWTGAMQRPDTAQKYAKGIQGTNVNPMEMAARPEALQLYAQRTSDSVASGRRAAKLMAVPVQRWKDNAAGTGAQRLTSGAVKAKSKVDAHFQKWAPIYQQASDAARALPKGGQANALARVSAALNVLMSAANRA